MNRSRLGFCLAGVCWLQSSLFAQSYSISTVAGTDHLRDGSLATTVFLRRPWGVTVDVNGNLYIADRPDHRIRRVTREGVISTVAGSGVAGFRGDNGPALQAQFNSPQAVALDGRRNILYVADYNNNLIRSVDLSTGTLRTYAGTGDFRASGDGGPARNAGFDPDDLAIDNSGNLYIADKLNNRIRKIDAATGVITTIAGSGPKGFSGDNGPAVNARLDAPTGISLDTAGNLYFVDQNNGRVRRVEASSGTITTVAGNGSFDIPNLQAPATTSPLLFPNATAIDAAGSLYILDLGAIWRITGGNIFYYGGSFTISLAGDGGPPEGARFAIPTDLTVAPNGDFLIADTGNQRIRKIASQVVTTVAGGRVGDGGPATSAFLNFPEGVAVDPAGNVYISDTGNARIRKIGAAGGIISTIGGSGVEGTSQNRIWGPGGLAVDGQGNVYFAELENHRVQKIDADGAMRVIAGTGESGFSGDGGPAVQARLSAPGGVALDGQGNLLIADTGNFRVRRMNLASGTISTIAGNGNRNYTGDNGQALQAGMFPAALAVDSGGNLFIAEPTNHRVRRVAAGTGIITTYAGNGTAGNRGDGGPATSAQLNRPIAVALDSSGNLFIGDYDNEVVRRVASTDRTITTIAGNGAIYLDRDNVPALSAAVDPRSLAVDRNGIVYVADKLNSRIRKLTPQTPAGLGVSAGNNQSGQAGSTVTVSVRVTDSGGAGVAGITVNFTVTSGSASIAAAAAVTNGEGVASAVVTLGPAAGPVVVTAGSAGLSSVTFNLQVTSGPIVQPAPLIEAGGVVGAGLSRPAVRALAPGGIASLFGGGFAPPGTLRRAGQEDLMNGRVPANLIGVCVSVGSARAPVFSVTPTQVNFQVPAVAAAASVPVRVITGCGTATEAQSAPESVAIQAAGPEFFYFTLSQDGRNPVAAVSAVSGEYIGRADLIAGAVFRPARPGEVLSIYATGLGAVQPAVAPGEIPAAIASVAAEVRVTLGGREVPAANVLYTGIAPFNPGLYQVNLVVPADTPDGDLTLVITVAGAPSPGGAYLTIRRPGDLAPAEHTGLRSRSSSQ